MNSARKQAESTGPVYYWHGDAAEFTGKVVYLHGETFHEIRLIEGHLTGETRVISQRQKDAQ
jgi:hypothetical protein